VCGSSTGNGASAPPHAAACSCFARALALDQPGVSPSVGPLRRARLLPTSRSSTPLAFQEAFFSANCGKHGSKPSLVGITAGSADKQS